jgi:hypothetical protein
MARGRKKKADEAATRKPSNPEVNEQDGAKEPVQPVRDPVQKQPNDVVTREEKPEVKSGGEPRYFIVKGSFTAGTTVIGPKDKHRPGDEPGQMRPEYTPGGVEALEHWVKAGYMVKK